MRCLFTMAMLLLSAGFAAAQEAPATGKAQAKGEREGQAHINEQYVNPDLDASSYVQRFERKDREVYAAREAIVAALGLKPGMRVADVGAGTGFYARLFAAQVGPEGKVYAVDIAPAFLKHIEAQAKRDGQAEIIQTILGTQDDTKLPPGTLDLVFTSDTYHHLERPSVVLATIHKALKPGGRLVVIDYDRHERSSEFVRSHIRAPKEVFFQEITAAGFVMVPTPHAPPLRDNFFAMFQKEDSASGSPATAR